MMPYVRMLCNKYFLIYDFFFILRGTFKDRVLKCGLEVEWDPRSTAAQVPFHFDGYYPILCYFSPEILIFQEPLMVEIQNQQYWIWHTSNPIYNAAQAILMHFYQSK